MIITTNNISDVYQAKKASIDTMQLKGYELLKEFFVDNSRLGLESEPALTQGQLEYEINNFLLEYKKPVTAKITGAGMFQVYLGLFAKTGKKICKKIANNTLLIDYSESKRAIRLHDTDILTESNGVITIDSGGYETLTTKRRINEYLPSGYYISQKDFIWYLNTPQGVKEYKDGLQVKGYLNI